MSALDPRSACVVPGRGGVSREYGFPGQSDLPPPPTEGPREEKQTCGASSSAPDPSRPRPAPPSRSHGHFRLAGCVAGVVARDVVQLLHGVVSARGERLALGGCLALAQRGIRVTGGTGMRVHLGHAVAVQHGRGHKDVRMREGPRQGLLREGRPLRRRGQQGVLGVQALGGEQTLVGQDAVIGQAEVVRQAALGGQDSVLGHGANGPAGSLARQGLLLGHLDDVEGQGAPGSQVRQVPPPHIILVCLLVSCRERQREKGDTVTLWPGLN